MSELVVRSRAVLADRARSFRWAAAFLPAESHDDAALLYAFCRAVDDAADDGRTIEASRAALEGLERELCGSGLGDSETSDLVTAVTERVLDRPACMNAAFDLLEGAKSDLRVVRVADDAELIRYAYRVAGTVGVMMCRVLGVEDPAALPHAVDLGIAMQLTNICRDVLEDAKDNRVYLPATRLREAGCSPEDVVSGRADPRAVARVVRDLLLLAERYYASADAGLRYIPRRPRMAILVASRLYRAIGLRLLRSGGDALAGRTVVPWWEKVGWIASALCAWTIMRWRDRYLQPHHGELHAQLDGATHASPG